MSLTLTSNFSIRLRGKDGERARIKALNERLDNLAREFEDLSLMAFGFDEDEATE